MQTHFLGAFIVFFSSCPRGVGVDKRQFSKVIYSDAWRKLNLTFFSFFAVICWLRSRTGIGQPTRKPKSTARVAAWVAPFKWPVGCVFHSAICQEQQQHQVNSSNMGQKTTNHIYIYIWFFNWISQLQLATFLGSEFYWVGLAYNFCFLFASTFC